MGNILCKDSPRRVYVKSPVAGNRNTSYSVYEHQQIQPNSLTRDDSVSPKRFNNTRTNFFHSTPNLVDGKMNSTISLDGRIFDSGKCKSPPVAPPRKKRSTLKKGSTLPTSFADGSVPNGFKDVFINGGVSKVFQHEEIKRNEKEDNVVQTRAASESEDEMSREKKLNVGNKKTDKFFGESLSDHLSDEPVLRIDESKDETDVNYTADKKLFFLMNMLEQDHDEESNDIKLEISKNNEEPIDRKRADEEDDEVLYKGRVPVEEPPFIARKKVVKHICDDDEHMHHLRFHSHEKDTTDSDSHITAPPKPDRDFSKYHSNPLEVDEKALEEIQAKPRLTKLISRESLPSPPEAPKRKSGIGSLPGTPTITIESIDFIIPNENITKKEIVEPVKEKIENVVNEEETVKRGHRRHQPLTMSRTPDHDPILKDEPQTPQTPIFTHEIMDHVFKKAYGFQGFHPEDTEHNHDDGSSTVAPKSKLTTRKISVTRKISTESMSSSVDGDSARSNELLPPGSPRKKISFSDDPLSRISECLSTGDDQPRTPPTSPMKNRDYNQMLNAASMKDIIDEIYSKNSEIMIEFQSYLEKSIESKPVINVDEEKEFLKKKGISDNEFTRTPEPKLSERNDEEVDDNQSYSDSFESTDTEQETITELGKGPNKMPKFNTRRRESIEDVDNWFNNHLKMDQNESDICGFMEGTEPTGAIGYDHQKIFPFGRTITGRRDSSSEEFFAGLPQTITRSHIAPLRESESSISEDESKSKIEDRQTSPDHSTLLKFLDKEAKEII